MTTTVLPQLVIILGVGVAAAVVVALLRLPAVAGFMLAGAIIGPSGFALVKDAHAVEVMAEIGVILLLFTIGLEFSLDRLKRIGKLVAVGGTLQVGLTTAAVVGAALAFGETLARGVFFGFLMALSSTAIVLRGLTERGETDAPHGRFTVGALIFQDLCVVPMMLLVPVLAGESDDAPALGIALALGKAALFIVVTLVVGRLLLPRILVHVDAARSREVFLLAVLVVCAGIATLTASFGLSLALGAFLAGILLSDTAFGHRAMANVLPLRDLLTSVFFLSLGMLFDASVFRTDGLLVAVLFAALFFGKGLIATLASLAMKFPARVAWLAGVSLAQFGEFGFVLAKEGERVGLIAADESRVLLAAGLLSMFVTPLSMRLAPHVTAGARLLRPLERLLGVRGIDEADEGPSHGLTGHVIVAGYGLGGQMLVRSLRDLEIPHVVLDMNVDSVRAGAAQGVPLYSADVTSDEVLRHAHFPEAAALVLLISDMAATRQAVAVARAISTTIPIVVRSHRHADSEGLKALGANEVISDELEGGVEVLARVLRLKGTPINVIGPQVRRARDDRGAADPARRFVIPRPRLGSIADLAELKVQPVVINEGTTAVGKALADLALRSQSGAQVLAVRRGEELVDDIDPTRPLEAGDILYLAGTRENVYRALVVLGAGSSAPSPSDG